MCLIITVMSKLLGRDGILSILILLIFYLSKVPFLQINYSCLIYTFLVGFILVFLTHLIFDTALFVVIVVHSKNITEIYANNENGQFLLEGHKK